MAILVGAFLMYSTSCNEKEEGKAYILIDPEIGTTDTEFYFKSSSNSNCSGTSISWTIYDPDGIVIDLGYDRDRTSFEKKFEKLGIYDVRLFAYGCGATSTFRVVESLDEIPVAVLKVDPETGPPSTTFVFDASESHDDKTPSEELLVRWDWNSDGVWDIEYTNEKTAEKIFDDPEDYEVDLQVKDADGNESEIAEFTVKVNHATGAPEAIFNIDPEYGTTITDFVFNASESWDIDTPIEDLLFSWDFEDDGVWELVSSHQIVVEHRYDEEGEFNIRLKVEDEDGLFDYMTESVPVVNCINGGEPCPGTPTVTHMGKTYNTVKIDDQCWLKENLNAGSMINGNVESTDNEILEKYCYDNDESFCNTYGALYQWEEAMQYNDNPGGQGICPDGWHIPTAEEWDLLAVYLDGHELAGMLMKSCTDDWLPHVNHINTNESGFTGLPGGTRHYNGTFGGVSEGVSYWTSTTDMYPNRAFLRTLRYESDELHGYDNNGGGVTKKYGFYVRCVMDSN